VGSTRAREATQANDPESRRGDARADARARALVGEQHDPGSRTLGARRRQLADRPGGGGTRNVAKHGGNPARPTVRWYQASLATKKGGAFGTHVKRVRRNGPAVPECRCAGVRGGSTVARHSTGKGKSRERRSSRDARAERWRRHLQECVPAWHDGRHHIAQARRRDGGQGGPALDSMAGHRGK
jgi:hypothetical protein